MENPKTCKSLIRGYEEEALAYPNRWTILKELAQDTTGPVGSRKLLEPSLLRRWIKPSAQINRHPRIPLDSASRADKADLIPVLNARPVSTAELPATLGTGKLRTISEEEIGKGTHTGHTRKDKGIERGGSPEEQYSNDDDHR